MQVVAKVRGSSCIALTREKPTKLANYMDNDRGFCVLLFFSFLNFFANSLCTEWDSVIANGRNALISSIFEDVFAARPNSATEL